MFPASLQGTLYLSTIIDLYGSFIAAYQVMTENSNQLVFETVKKQKKRSLMD